MNQQMASEQHEILAMLCLMGQESHLFRFASKKAEPLLAEASQRLFDENDPDDLSPRMLVERVRKLGQISHRSILDSIHPGWILESLSDESPRLIGILCRILSGEQAKYLIEHTKGRLPSLQETYRVPEPVVDLVWKHLEEKFQASEFPSPSGNFDFQHLAVLKGDDLKRLFWDLGLEEIRRAFHHVETNILRAFLSRFSPREAQEVRSRIEGGPAVSPDIKKEAQAHILALPLEQLTSELLLREIGYSVFARALLPGESSWVERLWQKLAPEEGYRLKRIVQETPAESSSQAGLKARREEIVARVFHLANKGLIRYYWKR